MADSSEVGGRAVSGPPDPNDFEAFTSWLVQQPRTWSVVLAARAALRVLPLSRVQDRLSVIVLPAFRATAIARFAAKYPNRAIGQAAADARASAYAATAATVDAADAAYGYAAVSAVSAATAASADAAYAATVAYADAASATAYASASASATAYAVIQGDAQRLHDGAMTPEQLASASLWIGLPPPSIGGAWQGLAAELRALGPHWSVWIHWYEDVLAGSPHAGTSEAEEAAFTDLPGELPWDAGAEAVNTEIARRLRAIRDGKTPLGKDPVQPPDPEPLETIPSPIAIDRRADGRIGADAGLFALPTLPPSSEPCDHARLLEACRARAEQLRIQAVAPTFQGRSEYAELLAEYLQWLPSEAGSGNILLADGEARVLNKMFVAEQDVLPTAFASRLSTFLEDHLGLRPYYPELERHYHSIRTGRVATPLPRDAVESIRQIIHQHSPAVFDETVAPVMDETAKPLPAVTPLPAADAPPPDPTRPKPPRDPIADVDPAASRNFTFASAANRIYTILKSGKDVGDGVKGWNEVYAAFKERIPPLLKWLQENWPGGGADGGPTLPPTIGV
ncbi:hypothetical protein RPB_0786 [Rhodopseudomonas palustris HaA2]|uniref:Uncharacterized protein n=1 Tax=Rhodopseudomonas palustris (strain HaA2) TaxID=316058 RepID=Q2J213_RHOP2|nr:hypothetical protein [Rhodopseudomonas palustris]ABD05497.1 hypothetical protein RPB_0786 [Rhodopseudomonas palustris HaA2]